ncbi:hypothetical protein CB0940_12202 [Cercospora beticola]|uniref:Uncharacterized protein n=1 Tax=Cercospora beticola TaxID=122368 RepID=A0A2G5GRS7_CERBT|nr:hypothetical protein CB0940_12202 [Cercospora beticola]PIA82974.1 hypothetical protein CB0940_12202 [Cercospora beticola]WPA97802.1 hypothetical protein RHO25_002413 [Cercospora beticola]
MSVSTSSNTLPARIADLLRDLTPRDALKCEIFRTAFYNFIERGDSYFRGDLATRLGELTGGQRPHKRRKKATSVRSPLEKRARSYFQEQRARGSEGNEDGKIDDMWSAVECLQAACARSVSAYEDILRQSRPAIEGNRQKLALDIYKASSASSCTVESGRRFDLLHVEYEVKLLKNNVDRGVTATGATEGSVAAAEREFARLASADPRSVRNARENARPYVHVATHASGLGLVLMLGSQTRNLWERQLSNKNISWILDFCSIELKGVAERAQELQPIARELVVRGFQARGVDQRELEEGNHLFSAHFPQACQHKIQTDAIDALIAAADHLQTNAQFSFRSCPDAQVGATVTPELQIAHSSREEHSGTQEHRNITRVSPQGHAIDAGEFELNSSGTFVDGLSKEGARAQMQECALEQFQSGPGEYWGLGEEFAADSALLDCWIPEESNDFLHIWDVTTH